MKDQTKRALLIGGGLLTLLVLVVLTLFFLGIVSLSIAPPGTPDPTPHNVTAYGFHWTITPASPGWVSNGLAGGDNSCRYTLNYDSPLGLDVPQTGATSTCNYNVGGTISANDLVIENYSEVDIQRSGTVCVAARANNAGGGSSINGVITPSLGSPNPGQSLIGPAGVVVGRGSGLACESLGGIRIVRTNGQEILYANPEAPSGYVLPPGTTFSNGIGAASDGIVSLSYQITGVTLTPLPAASSPPVTLPPGPVVGAPGTSMGTPVITYPPSGNTSGAPSLPWYQTLLESIVAFFKKLSGLNAS